VDEIEPAGEPHERTSSSVTARAQASDVRRRRGIRRI
jgi:hypothetical protein